MTHISKDLDQAWLALNDHVRAVERDPVKTLKLALDHSAAHAKYEAARARKAEEELRQLRSRFRKLHEIAMHLEAGSDVVKTRERVWGNWRKWGDGTEPVVSPPTKRGFDG